MFETIVGIVLLLLGYYQLYATRNVFVYTKKHGNKRPQLSYHLVYTVVV